jgi:hypothetical protein
MRTVDHGLTTRSWRLGASGTGQEAAGWGGVGCLGGGDDHDVLTVHDELHGVGRRDPLRRFGDAGVGVPVEV